MPALGMMDSAFFVSRTDLLSWLNGSLQLNVTKVEQCANGAVYCLIVESCHPGTVAMKKVNWNARQDHEFIPNYKVLQAAFQKLGIEKHIDVDKLIRGKPQDNLEMLQFMKYWADSTGVNPSFDPQECRRGMARLPEWAVRGKSILGERNRCTRMTTPRPRARYQDVHVAKGKEAICSATVVPWAKTAPAAPKVNAELQQRKLQVAELHTTVDALQAERDYYFRKLREVEVVCQRLEERRDNNESLPNIENLKNQIKDILYAKDDEDERPDATPLRPGRPQGNMNDLQ